MDSAFPRPPRLATASGMLLEPWVVKRWLMERATPWNGRNSPRLEVTGYFLRKAGGFSANNLD